MSKKIGSKLAESLRQRRANSPNETVLAEGARTKSSKTSSNPARPDEQLGKTIPQEPAASHGVLHPPRIWPD